MNLHAIDWVILIAFLAMIFFVVFYFKRFTRTVSDFMVASRMAGPYMLVIAPGVMSVSLLIANGQQTYNNGLSSGWWQQIGVPVSMLLTLFGFVAYRLRATKTMTLAQFLEVRYSRSFRIFSGILCWTSGVLNYGIFPMVSARCLITLLQLPATFPLFGFNVETYPVTIFILMVIACTIACVGGQVGILFTGFFMNLISFALCLVFMYFMLFKFPWNTIVEGLRIVEHPETQNLMNPFKAFDADGFNIWFFIIMMAFNAYSRGCWQGGAGLGMSAKTPHDNVMSGVLGRYRAYAPFLMILILPLGAYAMLHLPQYAPEVAGIKAHLAGLATDSLRDQARLPLILAHILPAGLFGLFVIMLLAGSISIDASYIHSWGTILIQDIVMPLRKKPFEAKTHLLLLRLGILGVATFAFFFSWFFPLNDYITMYQMITGAIYMGGAGAVVVGGLYWKRGSTCAAWTAMIFGTVICCLGLYFQNFWSVAWNQLHALFPNWAYLTSHQAKFPIPTPIVTVITMAVAIGSYVLVSLLGPKHEHNMDKLLHRGEYAEEDTRVAVASTQFSWSKLVGITPEHTKSERVLVYTSFYYTMGMFSLFLVVTILALTTDWLSDRFWEELQFWKNITPGVLLGTIATIWIVCGGLRDLVNLIKDLRNYKANDKDDGFVE